MRYTCQNISHSFWRGYILKKGGMDAMKEAQDRPQNMEDILCERMGGVQKNLEVYMDDERITLEEALHRCVQERAVYMPDYVLDEKGVLKQLRFDKVDLL